MTHLTQDEAELVARLRYRVNNPSAWSEFEQAGSDLVSEAALEISRIAEEREEARVGYARLMNRISEIREASGLGAKPMLDELPEAIGAALSQMKEALRKMHRRAQRAEGQRDAGMFLLNSWDRHSSDPRHFLLNIVIEQVRKALSRRDLAQQPDKEGI